MIRPSTSKLLTCNLIPTLQRSTPYYKHPTGLLLRHGKLLRICGAQNENKNKLTIVLANCDSIRVILGCMQSLTQLLDLDRLTHPRTRVPMLFTGHAQAQCRAVSQRLRSSFPGFFP